MNLQKSKTPRDEARGVRTKILANSGGLHLQNKKAAKRIGARDPPAPDIRLVDSHGVHYNQ
jgi:hypothetical protein